MADVVGSAGAEAAVPMAPLSTGQLLDRVVRIYRRDFALFTAIAAAPCTAIAALQIRLQLTRGTLLRPERLRVAGSLSVVLMELAVLTLVAYVVAATACAVDSLREGNASALRACRAAGRRILTLAGATTAYLGCLLPAALVGVVAYGYRATPSTIVDLAAIAAELAAIVGAAITALRLALFAPAIALERCDTFGALGRSRRLTKRSAMRVLLVLLAIYCFNFALSAAFGVVAGGIAVAAHARLLSPLLFTIAAGASELFSAPLLGIALALLYLDLRMRKEGLDVELLLRREEATSTACVQPRDE